MALLANVCCLAVLGTNVNHALPGPNSGGTYACGCSSVELVVVLHAASRQKIANTEAFRTTYPPAVIGLSRINNIDRMRLATFDVFTVFVE